MATTFSVIALFGNVGWPEVVIILLLILLLFGGRKLPELARGLGKGLRLFRKELHGLNAEPDSPDEDSPPSQATPKLHDQQAKDDSTKPDEDAKDA